MKRITMTLAWGMLAVLPGVAFAQGGSYASSRAMNGGTAISISTSSGNARSVANSSANGGRAQAVQHSVGYHGGYADGVTNAQTVGGRSYAQGVTQAMGPYSVANSNTLASSFYGNADSINTSIAGPFGQTHSNAAALSNFGHARADGYGSATYGSAYSDVLSHSFGPFTYGRSYGHSQGMAGGHATSRSHSVGVGMTVPTYANSIAESYGQHGGAAHASAAHIVYGGN